LAHLCLHFSSSYAFNRYSALSAWRCTASIRSTGRAVSPK
jgi:hypothetical protein